ncbi:DciA family protein [Kutzneria viridogrisea]|uniref:DciA family protein n=1 Tax=Kutzneria TaxID=43356 RepID=UPI00338660F6
MDNSVTPGRQPGSGASENRTNGLNDPENSTAASPGGGQPARGIEGLPEGLKGSDLARAALESARASVKARGAGRRGKLRNPSAGSGRRRRWSGPGADDRDPQPLGRLAARIAAERGWTEQLSGGQVFARWAKLVGEDVAQHAKPITLRDGELVVQAESTAWATQLRLLQRQLLQRIAAGIGPNVVKRLKVQGPSAPNWRFGPLHAPGRGPRDTYG